MRALFRYLACLSLLVAPLAHALETSDIPPSPIAKATLMVDAPSIKAGEAVTAAVTFSLPPHWHIYWQNPGDSGIPTTFSWTLPDGLKAGEIAWPAPERFDTQGLINYGYSNEVTLLVPLTPSTDSISGDVKLKANWLVCKEICIPESAELTAPLAANASVASIEAATRAKLPQPFTGTATYALSKDSASLTLTQDVEWGSLPQVRFSPIEDGIVANNPAPTTKVDGKNLTLTFSRGTAEPAPQLHGVLHYRTGDKEIALDVAATMSDAPLAAVATPPATSPLSFAITLLFAFLGGLILNVMPCVLPILALKALSLSKKATASRRNAAMQGFSFTAGVIASFVIIAGLMLALKATGSAIGWGFQLQNPYFVGVLALIMALVSANLFGLFELPVLFGERATGVDESKLSGSFFTGVLAVLVATPCSAPFMATAIGVTLSLPTAQALLVFVVLGFGMAAPFLLISLWPAARRLLPKPGAWMHRFKQFLALPMLATALWLLWVLVQLVQPATPEMMERHEAYSAARLEQLRAEGTPVLVDATADWCLTCKLNERVAIKPQSMQEFFREKNVTLMIADWTNSDPEITKYLASFGRNGVPLYVFYPTGGEPKVLPQLLTPSMVREAIEGKAN
jgi:thiol:disulfide interchange protein DsbD